MHMMIPSDISPVLPSILAFIESVPRPKNRTRGRDWRSDPRGVAIMVSLILGIEKGFAPCHFIATKAKMSASTLRNFIRGNDSSGQTWPALRKALAESGIVPPPKRRRGPLAPKQATPAETVTPDAVTPDAVKESTPTAEGPYGSGNWTLDPATDDIIVLVPHRLVYGTLEHRQKIREITLAFGG